MVLQKDDAHAVALNGAAAALLKSGSLRPRVVASLRAASSGFRQLCQEHEVSIAANARKAPAAAIMISRMLPLPMLLTLCAMIAALDVAGRAAAHDAPDLGRRRCACPDARSAAATSTAATNESAGKAPWGDAH